MQETQERWVWSLGPEDPLEEEMAPYSSIPDCKIPREEPGGLQSVGPQSAGHEKKSAHTNKTWLQFSEICSYFMTPNMVEKFLFK